VLACLLAALFCIAIAPAGAAASSASKERRSFEVEEASIADIQAAIVRRRSR
jgi:hypothetical protein